MAASRGKKGITGKVEAGRFAPVCSGNPSGRPEIIAEVPSVTIRRDERGRALELTPAMVANKWVKGFAPNPGGLGGAYHECMRLARTHSIRAVERLANHRLNVRAWPEP